MVTVIRDAATAQDVFVITPYMPISGKGSLVVLLIVWSLILSVALVCGMLGNWAVLPASLAVCIALGLAFRSAHRRTQQREVVSLAAGQLSIEQGHHYPEHWCSLPCADATVLLQPAPTGTETHLFICTKEQQVEVGSFLDDMERHELADRLRELLRAATRLRPEATA